MPRAQANGMELEYDTTGDPGAPPLLLVMGLGAQMIAWEDEFCERLAGRGFCVPAAIGAALSGGPVDAPYLLADMADDAFALLHHLGVDRAHVVGASMGGMIAQTMAIARPERVATLTSIMSTTGNREVGTATPEYVANAVATMRLLHGPVLPFDEERAAARAAGFFDRCYHPTGVGQQLVAILASGDRTEALAGPDVPPPVFHG